MTQKAGIAKAAGRFKGRPPSIDKTELEKLKAAGMSPTQIAKELGIGRASVYRILGQRYDRGRAERLGAGPINSLVR